MRADARHQLINLAHSALLLLGMAATVWISASAVFDPFTSAMAVLGFAAATLLAPRAPKEALLSLYRAKRLDARSFPGGVRALEILAQRAELPMAPALYYLPSAAPNAFAIGSRADSAVCVSDGLLRLLTPRELVGVLAHEVSHVAHGDLWIMGMADAMSRLTTLLSYLGQFLLLLNIPLLLMGESVISWWCPLALILAPTVASLMQLALSRTREFDADRGAAALSGDAAGIASALAKLDRRMGRFWEELILPGRRIPEPSLLRTHPPTAERIARLKALAPAPRPAPIEPPATLAIPIKPVAGTPRLYWTGVWR